MECLCVSDEFSLERKFTTFGMSLWSPRWIAINRSFQNIFPPNFSEPRRFIYSQFKALLLVGTQTMQLRVKEDNKKITKCNSNSTYNVNTVPSPLSGLVSPEFLCQLRVLPWAISR